MYLDMVLLCHLSIQKRLREDGFWLHFFLADAKVKLNKRISIVEIISNPSI